MSPLHFRDSDLRHFESIAWCATLFRGPDIRFFQPTCRLPGDASHGSAVQTQDQLFRKTLRDPTSVPHCIGFYQDRPWREPEPYAKAESSSLLLLTIPSISLIFDLQPGLNGFNGSLHGGIIGCLADEAMGSLIYHNHQNQLDLQKSGIPLPHGVLDLGHVRCFTASMKILLLKPLPTPKVVIVTATLERIDRRKMFFRVTIRNGKHAEYATCDGMWMTVPLKKL